MKDTEDLTVLVKTFEEIKKVTEPDSWEPNCKGRVSSCGSILFREEMTSNCGKIVSVERIEPTAYCASGYSYKTQFASDCYVWYFNPEWINFGETEEEQFINEMGVLLAYCVREDIK